MNKWYIALAYEVKKHNPNAFWLSPGKFLWRKFSLRLKSCLLDPIRNSKKRPAGFRYTTVHAINLYIKNRYILPPYKM